MTNIRQKDFSSEWQFRTSRSGGKGGQNVNKVETRVELLFQPEASAILTPDQKKLVSEKMANRINAEGFLIISSEEDRSQLKNKENAIRKFYDLLDFALRVPRTRKKTKPTKSSVQKRLNKKKKQSEKKAMRRGYE